MVAKSIAKNLLFIHKPTDYLAEGYREPQWKPLMGIRLRMFIYLIHIQYTLA